jgi:hypothetical protein
MSDTVVANGTARTFKFRTSTHKELLMALLPLNASMHGHQHKVFPAERIEPLLSPRDSLGIRFGLTGYMSMTIELLVATLRDFLESLRIVRICGGSRIFPLQVLNDRTFNGAFHIHYTVISVDNGLRFFGSGQRAINEVLRQIQNPIPQSLHALVE